MNQENLNNLDTQQESPEQDEVSRQLKEMAEWLDKKDDDFALENQDAQLIQQESKYNKKTLVGLRKWLTTGLLMGSSLLAVGCNNEKPSSGFTDNEHAHVQRVLKAKKAEIKHMKEMKNYKPSKTAIESGREMSEQSIVQPIDNNMEIK